MWTNTEMCSAKRQTAIKISDIYSVFPENIYEFKIQGRQLIEHAVRVEARPVFGSYSLSVPLRQFGKKGQQRIYPSHSISRSLKIVQMA